MKNNYPELLPYCKTSKQIEIIETLIETDGSVPQTSEVTGMIATNVYRTVREIKKIAASKGYAPESDMVRPSAEGFTVKRITRHHALNKETGQMETRNTWVQEKPDIANEVNAMEAWARSLAETTIPRAEPTACPDVVVADLLASYEIGDAHVGMYAWAKEADVDWDLMDGVTILRSGINHLINGAPAAEIGYILDTGDFFHADNQSNETSHSGNKLDVDGRWAEVLEAGMQAIIDMIDLALTKHKKVLFRSAVGNHNEHTAIFMNMALRMRYHDEPRLEILDSPSIHHYYQFGCNLLADTHGHTGKADNLPLVMANDVPEMWAGTTNRVWRMGHIHHHSAKEFVGATVISYNTLTPVDSWHRASGYRSNRTMTCTLYNKHFGTVGTQVVNASMLGY